MKELQNQHIKQYFLQRYEFDMQINNTRANQDKLSILQQYQQCQSKNFVCGINIKKNKILNNLYNKLSKIQANLLLQSRQKNLQIKNKKSQSNLYEQINQYKNMLDSQQFKNCFKQIENIHNNILPLNQKLENIIKICKRNIANSNELQIQSNKLQDFIYQEQKNIQKLQKELLKYQQELENIEKKIEYQKFQLNLY